MRQPYIDSILEVLVLSTITWENNVSGYFKVNLQNPEQSPYSDDYTDSVNKATENMTPEEKSSADWGDDYYYSPSDDEVKKK